MNTPDLATARKPRSAARRAQLRIPSQEPIEEMQDEDYIPVRVTPSRPAYPQQAPAPRQPAVLRARPAIFRPAPPPGPLDAWEDTNTSAVLRGSGRRAFLNRQPPLFWIVGAVLMIALFAVIVVISADKWKEMNEEQAEARRLQQLADEKARYKLLYADLIEQNANEYGVDPALIAAVIYNESRFQPEAESYLGARGLMQIMETTGPWIAGWLNDEDSYTFDDMFLPEKNIRYGTWYLGFLAREFSNDIIKIAAGYHAGQNQVKAWLDDPRYSKDGEALQYIPDDFESTKNYVEGVISAYEMYKKHYYAPAEVEGDLAA